MLVFSFTNGQNVCYLHMTGLSIQHSEFNYCNFGFDKRTSSLKNNHVQEIFSFSEKVKDIVLKILIIKLHNYVYNKS